MRQWSIYKVELIIQKGDRKMSNTDLHPTLSVPEQYREETRRCLEDWSPNLIESIDEENAVISDLLWEKFKRSRSRLSGCDTEKILNLMFSADVYAQLLADCIDVRVVPHDNENLWIVLFNDSPCCLLTNSKTDLSLIKLDGIRDAVMNEPENFRGIENLSDITYLRLYSPLITDLGMISALKEIQTLNLASCKALSDINALSNLKNLKELDMSACKSVTDISVLASLRELETVMITGASLIDLNPLKHVKNITIKQ